MIFSGLKPDDDDIEESSSASTEPSSPEEPKIVSGAEFLSPTNKRSKTVEESENQIIEIWPDNMQAFNVFRMCQMSYVQSGSEIRAIGFSARELESACAISCIPRKNVYSICEEVKFVGSKISAKINK